MWSYFCSCNDFGAEAVSNFLMMVRNAFSVSGAQKPEHIFYDTNCDVRQQTEKDLWFKGVGMCVDAWYFHTNMPSLINTVSCTAILLNTPS